MLRIKDITVKYGNFKAVDSVSHEFKPGTLTFIIGPNGSGKSSLLKAINHLVDFEGQIVLNQQDIKTFLPKEKALQIGYIAQMNEIMFPYTIFETVLMGRYPHLNNDYSDYQSHDRKIVFEVLKNLNLLKMKDKLITTCSGGELQRVYIARLLVQETDVVLVDEITNHLDIKYQIETLDLLLEMAHHHQKCVIGVIHDLKMAQNICDNLLVLNQGQIIFSGPPKDLKLETISEIYQIDKDKLYPYLD